MNVQILNAQGIQHHHLMPHTTEDCLQGIALQDAAIVDMQRKGIQEYPYTLNLSLSKQQFMLCLSIGMYLFYGNGTVLWRLSLLTRMKTDTPDGEEENKIFVPFPGYNPISLLRRFIHASELACLILPIRLVCPDGRRERTKTKKAACGCTKRAPLELLTITFDW